MKRGRKEYGNKLRRKRGEDKEVKSIGY